MEPPLSQNVLKIATFNVKNVVTNINALQKLFEKMDIICIQEHWLFQFEVNFLKNINNTFEVVGKTVDNDNPLPPTQKPRGYGGVSVFWKKD